MCGRGGGWGGVSRWGRGGGRIQTQEHPASAPATTKNTILP